MRTEYSYKNIVLILALLCSGCNIGKASKEELCNYNNLQYELGASFPAVDSCNVCTCQSDGVVTCTELSCETKSFTCSSSADCENLGLEQSFCEDGEWSCIEQQCQFYCDIGGTLAP